MIVANNAVVATYWRVFSAVGWCLFYSVFLLFTICLTTYDGLLAKPVFKVILPIPALIFFVHAATRSPDAMVLSDWGWTYVYTNEVSWQIAFIIYYSSYVLAGFWLIHSWGKQARTTREKQQAKIILKSMLTVAIIGAPFDTYLPLLGYPVLPIAILLSTMFIAAIWYAITRYKLMMLDFDTAADHILQNMIDPVLLVGTNSLIREVNASFLMLTGFDSKVVIGKTLADITTVNSSSDAAEKRNEVLLKTQNPTIIINCLMVSKILQDEFGDILGHIVLLHDVGTLKRYEELLKQSNEDLEARIEHRTRELAIANMSLQQENKERMAAEEQAMILASFDSLTGLPNRRKFNEKAKFAVNKAGFLSETVAVLFIDLDNFKSINDTFGHSYGDAILVEIAARMKPVILPGDTLSRMGGDEFLLLMEGLHRNGDAIDVVTQHAEVIRRQFEKPFFLNNRESFLSVSIGIALYPEDGEDAETLLQHADIAMYAAKQDGRNKLKFCSPEMKRQVTEKNLLRKHLMHAIANNELELHYQPQIDIKNWKIIGFEALLRWRMNNEQFVPPSQFIPIAEETDLILPIGNWVMNTAFSQLQRWNSMGFVDLTMAVNLSARQIREADFIEQVLSCLEKADLKPEMVELEVTESQAFNNDDRMIFVLQQLKQHHIGISIDDFGTDYSSFMNMKKVSFDRLKIAREFVSGIGKSKKDEAIVRSIIELTHRLDLKVIAEGVETAEELKYLLQAECDEVQGYFFFRPMPAAEIEGVLIRWENENHPQ